ncbi:T9SS type A sorting domain-containing protein [Adhaeribacter pallidiroseus]|uniref:Secretion system C-terminal sorting domain-containing protein n=1 Tax=Adhaeribacter pallidiroseus TaxID=2072847 RepID=A0A369QPL1_9BACT|nr:T9SS type A sorting domain-containing protein [Adhaeribacter pallidiroseus]RDC65605.1 hypothetical protein AHMF7616_04235 [Adhaeribacter pallidiroseus]
MHYLLFQNILNETLTGIVTTANKGFLLGGTSLSGQSGDKSEGNRGGSDFWLISVDKNNNKLWDKTYGGSDQDGAYSLGRSGNAYFISGQGNSPAGADKTAASRGGKEFWFLKPDANDAKVWDKTFGGTIDEELRASIYTQAGGYLLAGRSYFGKNGDKRQDSQGDSAYWLIKIALEKAPALAMRQVTASPTETTAPAKKLPVHVYPNSFREKVKVCFTLPQTEATIITVYNGQGQVLTTLFPGEAQANRTYEAEGHAPDKPAGIYFFKITNAAAASAA